MPVVILRVHVHLGLTLRAQLLLGQPGKRVKLPFPELGVKVRAQVDLLRQEDEAVGSADGGAIEEVVNAAGNSWNILSCCSLGPNISIEGDGIVQSTCTFWWAW